MFIPKRRKMERLLSGSITEECASHPFSIFSFARAVCTVGLVDAENARAISASSKFILLDLDFRFSFLSLSMVSIALGAIRSMLSGMPAGCFIALLC